MTESINTECQAISYRLTIDFRALMRALAHPTFCVRESNGPFRIIGCSGPNTAFHIFQVLLAVLRSPEVR